MARPYQPSLLRLLHGLTAALVPLAWLSGFFAYSNLDGRWGRLPWTVPGDWVDLHGTFGVVLWPVAILFGLYALTLGRRRLHQPANAVALLALVLAVGSGKMMQEDWLRDGQLDHVAYSIHLLAWLLIALAVAAHLSHQMGRGGWPLLRSMLSPAVQANDRPGHWFGQVRRGLFR